jgi:hypothetical protein
VDITSVVTACPVAIADTGSTKIILRETAVVIKNQWGDRIYDFKDLDLLEDSQIYIAPVR